jgi:hypothetical protein
MIIKLFCSVDVWTRILNRFFESSSFVIKGMTRVHVRRPLKSHEKTQVEPRENPVGTQTEPKGNPEETQMEPR